jgi:predicted nucleotidyltransferase
VTLLEQLRAILAALDHAGIEYALVGGLAVAVWGGPRATQDIDLLLVDTNLEPIWESRRQLDVEGTPIWVISREALIQMKLAAGRTRDVQDVERLEEIDR